jgi:hypothetical protein
MARFILRLTEAIKQSEFGSFVQTDIESKLEEQFGSNIYDYTIEALDQSTVQANDGRVLVTTSLIVKIVTEDEDDDYDGTGDED